MDYRKRKVIDYIREGLILHHTDRIKNTQNPYALLSEADMNYQEEFSKNLERQSETIFEHLDRMGVLK